jgi:hypothetical protein
MTLYEESNAELVRCYGGTFNSEDLVGIIKDMLYSTGVLIVKKEKPHSYCAQSLSSHFPILNLYTQMILCTHQLLASCPRSL